MSKVSEQIKRILLSNIPNAEVKVYELNGELLIEVVSPLFAKNKHVINQDRVLEVLNSKGNLGQHFYIQELLTYGDRMSTFNALAHLLTAPSEMQGGIFTSTLAAGDAYVYLAEIDAARLKSGWRHRQSGAPVSCTAVQANEGFYASFQIHESTHYQELEIAGQYHRVRKLQTQPDKTWIIDVTIGGGIADSHALR